MTETMPPGFEPRRRGRPPLVDPIPVYRRIEKADGEWISFTTYNAEQVRSLKVQLTRLGVDVSVSTTTAHKNPVMYCRIAKEN